MPIEWGMDSVNGRFESETRSSRTAGFTLLEAVVALAVLGVTLVSMLAILAQYAAVDRRLNAHIGALRALEAHHEALRGFWVPDPTEPLWSDVKVRQKLVPILVPEDVDTFSIWAETEPLLPTGLYRLRLETKYSLGKQKFSQVLESRFWRS